MKKVFIYVFCLFLLVISFIYIKDYINNNKIDIKTIKTFINNPIYKDNNSINIEDITPVKINTKNNDNNYLFYIYNTHQTEEYSSNNPYNLKVTTVTASLILEEALKELGYNSLVEKRNVMDEVRKNGWDYPSTYTVTKSYVKEIKEKYPSIKYFIDIHRDGAPISSTRVSIGDISYAKIMFTIGKKRDNLNVNLSLVEKLREYLNNNYKGILRNNFYRDDTSFNQELDNNMFLIEIGGQDNNLIDVYNSLNALAKAFNYLEEK